MKWGMRLREDAQMLIYEYSVSRELWETDREYAESLGLLKLAARGVDPASMVVTVPAVADGQVHVRVSGQKDQNTL